MADNDPADKPSLELPSFGFGRKKKKKPQTAETAESASEVPSPPVAPSSSTRPGPGEETTADLPASSAPTLPRASRKPAPVQPAASAGVTRTTTETVPPTGASLLAPARTAGDDGSLGAQPKAGRRLKLPALRALQAVLVVGAVVGLVGVLATFASLKFCELATGTDSCGGPGLLLLVATVVLLTYAGSWLLRGFGIADAGSLSFLAVALLAVTVMTFFLHVIYNWWMVLVIPLVSMAMYALSWWVTTSLVDDDSRRDIRPR